jgi:hypothetical protein
LELKDLVHHKLRFRPGDEDILVDLNGQCVKLSPACEIGHRDSLAPPSNEASILIYFLDAEGFIEIKIEIQTIEPEDMSQQKLGIETRRAASFPLQIACTYRNKFSNGMPFSHGERQWSPLIVPLDPR